MGEMILLPFDKIVKEYDELRLIKQFQINWKTKNMDAITVLQKNGENGNA